MIDISTEKPLRVSAVGNFGSCLAVPMQQIDEVRSLPDAQDIPYWVDGFSISLNGQPPVTVVNFGRAVDVAAVQRILDEAA